MTIAALIIALAAQQVAAAPQTAAPAPHRQEACPATPVAPPAGMEGWLRAAPARAGAAASVAAPLALGSAATATLLPTSGVTYAVRPEKPGSAASNGGIFAFDVPAAGRYRVALGAGAWVDVLSGTTPAVSVAHGHGPACSTIRKMVDFDLKPGRYLLQVAGNATATLPLMVSRLS